MYYRVKLFGFSQTVMIIIGSLVKEFHWHFPMFPTMTLNDLEEILL